MCVRLYYISLGIINKAYFADKGPVVTNRRTVTQLAIMQPTAACPAALTGKKPT